MGLNSRGPNVLFIYGVLGPRLCLGSDSLLACRTVYTRVCREQSAGRWHSAVRRGSCKVPDGAALKIKMSASCNHRLKILKSRHLAQLSSSCSALIPAEPAKGRMDLMHSHLRTFLTLSS